MAFPVCRRSTSAPARRSRRATSTCTFFGWNPRISFGAICVSAEGAGSRAAPAAAQARRRICICETGHSSARLARARRAGFFGAAARSGAGAGDAKSLRHRAGASLLAQVQADIFELRERPRKRSPPVAPRRSLAANPLLPQPAARARGPARSVARAVCSGSHAHAARYPRHDAGRGRPTRLLSRRSLARQSARSCTLPFSIADRSAQARSPLADALLRHPRSARAAALAPAACWRCWRSAPFSAASISSAGELRLSPHVGGADWHPLGHRWRTPRRAGAAGF